ncbi:MAG: hypothetical protein ABIA93_05610 [Candidatus Woesearchaeota archaeon]
MGRPNNRLVPAAILLDNPGINRDEFVHLLNQVRSTAICEYNLEHPWDSCGILEGHDFEDSEYHRGPHGLATILDLPERSREKYLFVHVLPWKWDGMWQRPDYSVVGPHLDEVTHYFSLESLLERHPQFDPDLMYDWNKAAGTLSSGPGRDNEIFWNQRDGNYYLAEKTFETVAPCRTLGRTGYTDIVMTAEAIRQGTWKLLSYNGQKHTNQFVIEHPESWPRICRAVWDAHASAYARKQGMTTTEMLHWRLLAPVISGRVRTMPPERIPEIPTQDT